MNSYNPARERFYKDNGDDYVKTPEGSILFSNGAEDENCIGGYGKLTFAPTDPWELAKKIAYFWEIKLTRAVTNFNLAKANLEGRAWHVYPWPDRCISEEQRIDHLKKLQKAVRITRRKYRAALEEADELEPKYRKRVREGQAEEDQNTQRLRCRVDRINI